MQHQWEKKNAYRIFKRKSEGNRPIGKQGHRSVDYTKMYLTVIGRGDLFVFMWLRIETGGGLLWTWS
jgi:hypothetical protein